MELLSPKEFLTTTGGKVWKIDRDYLNEKWNKEGEEWINQSRVGTVGNQSHHLSHNEGGEELPKIRFRLKDDDGIIYYGGWLHDDDECMNQNYAFNFGAYDAGTAHIEVKRNGEWVEEIG